MNSKIKALPTKWADYLMDKRLWIPPTILSIFLTIIAQFSLLGFHTLAELFAIVISFVIFAIAWSTRGFYVNNFLLFLACGYFWIGSLDLMHTLVYKGMNVFVEGSGNLSVQFWIGTRYIEGLLLLIAPIAATRKQNEYLLMIVFGAIATVLTALILTGQFPIGFVAGQGLTDFKIYSEYFIIFVLLLALVTVNLLSRNLSEIEKTFVTVSIILTICAELALTYYVTVFGLSNLIGHILKIYSFWFIFRAVVVTNLRKPHDDLTTSNERLYLTKSLLEETIQKLENQQFVLNHHAIVALTDATGKITYANQKFSDISGYSYDELIGQNHRILQSAHHSPAFYKQLWLTIANGQVWRGEFCNKAKDGSLYWVDTTIAPLKNIQGKIEQYIAVRTDITHIKQSDELLRRSQKMEAIGELTGGIAHDFNNLLGIIIGNLDLVGRKLEEGSNLQKQLATAQNAAFRGASLTRRLLNFSSQSPEIHSPVNVDKIICEFENLIQKSLTAVISIEIHQTEKAWMVELNPDDLEDALVNLALNARDAMPNGGKLVIETRNTILDHRIADAKIGIQPGEYVEIAIGDTGAGMSKEIVDKIFDPFFTTKSKDKGTGLGLAMVYGFVQRSKGHISVYSEVGVGTTFRMYLPRAQRASKKIEALKKVDEVLPIGHETILVVDDEDELLSIAQSILDELGYNILCASSGEEALHIIENNDVIDLLFSDVVMPGNLNGFDLADTVTKTHPEMKILLTSGFTGKIKHSGTTEMWAKKILPKPYRDIELAVRIRQTLDEG